MPGVDFSKMEEEILRSWEERKIFQKTLEKPAPQGNFVFFEGPPTANGKPGIHHMEPRSFKDLIPRYRTMRGYRVDRKAGWDTHGLPVELGVEKALGISGKPQIESLKATPKASIAFFNAECKKSVWTYLQEWEQMSKRIGFAYDQTNRYITYETSYMESLWWIMKEIWKKGLLYREYKIVPWCPRCGTALSSHELAQGYKTVTDRSVTVKFRLADDPKMSILAWTTTPWTLPGNIALAVHSDIRYVKVRSASEPGETYILAEERITALRPEDQTAPREVIATKELVGKHYLPLFDFLNLETAATEAETVFTKSTAYSVLSADFVTTADGTGVVHTAVMYGEDDFVLGKKVGLPKVHTVNEDGTFAEMVTPWKGLTIKKPETEEQILSYLKEHGLLYGELPYEHEYPFCWRCSTPLLYFARESWWIRMTELREQLLAANAEIQWTPEYIKEGRFGEWLRGIKDWSFSRERYWGTPLPIWVCGGCDAQLCIGSLAELKEAAGSLPKNGNEVDLHRPFVDELPIPCKACSGIMHRTKEVVDVWFDSGAMPFAQWHYPFENKEKIDEGKAFPADYISEAIDQTRGWFYTLLAVSVLLDHGAPYKHVISLGHVLDKKGQKMSKSKGNVVDPWSMIEKYGADCVRLYMYSINQPGDPKRFDEKDLGELQRKFFLILWNVLTFYKTYASTNSSLRGVRLGRSDAAIQSDNVLDRWILARLAQLTHEVTNGLETYHVVEPARALQDFVTDLSTWYVRRSRERFKSDDVQDAAAARETLGTVLHTFAKILAPFCPCTADMLYRELGGEKESVHLEDWPKTDSGRLDKTLLTEMDRVRKVVSLGLEQRAKTGLPVRQPLAKATITGGTFSAILATVIQEELNVLAVVSSKDGELRIALDTELTPALKAAGALRELSRHVQNLRKKSGMHVADMISLAYDAGALEGDLTAMHDELAKAVRAKNVSVGRKKRPFSEEVNVQGATVWIGIEKI